MVGKKLEDIEKRKEDVPEGSGPELWANDDEKWVIWRGKGWHEAVQWLVERYPYERPPVVYFDPQTLKAARQEDSHWDGRLTSFWSIRNTIILLAALLLVFV